MRTMLIVLLVCLVALVGCKTVSSFFANPPAVVANGVTVVPPAPAENLLDRIIGLATPFAPLVPWGGFAAAIAAALQQFLKLRRTKGSFAATVLTVQKIREDPVLQPVWSKASDWAITQIPGLKKETLTADINEVKVRVGLPIQ